jgi:Carboxypeptidase regulatory-like domain/TonB dependent receptor-like, beta-barrel
MRVEGNHKRHWLSIAMGCLCLVALVLTPALAAAQGAAQSIATILGQVTDESGAALPGVTVTLRSPALQVPSMSTTTDERGEYRLTPLPIGIYTVEYELSGFQTLRLNEIRLPAGFTAKLDQSLKIGALAETVTVSGQTPLVDVTQASTATLLETEALELLPSGTNGIVGFLAQVPGAQSNIEVGGSAITDTNIFVSNGQGGELWSLLEGVFAAASQTSASGTHYNFNAIEEARVQTSANGADTPKRGMSVNLITKSGGNAYHGAGEYAFTNHDFESDNITDELRRQGVVSAPKLITRKDGGGQLGGKLIQDKLWFFADLRYRKVIREIPFATRPDGSIIHRPQHQFFQAYKVSGQVNQTNKIIAFWHRYGDHEKRSASQFVPERAMEQNNAWGETWKLEWQATIGQSLTLSVQHGRFEHVNQYQGFAPGVPRSIDITTLKEDGDAVSDGRHSTNGQIHDRALLSWYRPDLFAGNHAFTFGFDFLDGGNGATNPPRRSGDYRLRFQNGAPFQIDVYNVPNAPELRTRYFAGYVQDSWTINRRLTLSIGLRAQRDRGWVPAQCQRLGTFVQAFPENCNPEVHPNVFNSVTPRIHAAFDVTGDGRSVIKGGYGQFVHLRSTGAEINNFNKNGQRTMTYDWRDLNGDRDYDPGEVNLDPNGPDFRSGGAQLNAFLNPDENIPGAEEYSIGFERQLTQTVAVRVSGVYLKNFNVNRSLNPLRPYEVYTIPISRLDPGPDGVNGTSDDPGKTLTYWDYPASYRGAAFEGVKLVNDDPRNDSTFKTIEFAATRRLSNGWQFMGSYSATKRNVPFVDGSALTPNAEINTADNTWTWIGKLAGSYTFRWGILGGVSYSRRNGARMARQVQILAPPGASITNLVVNAEPIGSLSLEDVGLLDMRVAKRFGLGAARNLELRLDCFNMMNVNPVTSIVTRAGPTFGNATASADGGQNGTGLTPPRILTFETRFTF